MVNNSDQVRMAELLGSASELIGAGPTTEERLDVIYGKILRYKKWRKDGGTEPEVWFGTSRMLGDDVAKAVVRACESKRIIGRVEPYGVKESSAKNREKS